MSAAIMKTPSISGARIALGSLGAHAPMSAKATQPLAPVETLEQAKARMQAEFDAKVDAAVQAGHEKGFAQGMAEGHAEGLASGKESFVQAVALLESTAEGWLNASAKANDQAITLAKKLALEALTLLVGQKYAEPSFVAQVVQQVASGLQPSDVTHVRMHPKDIERLNRAALSGVDHARWRAMQPKLVADPELALGGVVIDTPRGIYSAPLELQLEKLAGLIDLARIDVVAPTDAVVRNVRVA